MESQYRSNKIPLKKAFDGNIRWSHYCLDCIFKILKVTPLVDGKKKV